MRMGHSDDSSVSIRILLLKALCSEVTLLEWGWSCARHFQRWERYDWYHIPQRGSIWKDLAAGILAPFSYLEWANRISLKVQQGLDPSGVAYPWESNLWYAEALIKLGTLVTADARSPIYSRDQQHQINPASTTFLTLKGCISLAMTLNQFPRKPFGMCFFC